MNTARAFLYARTLPTLKPIQVLGRLWRVVHTPRPDISPSPKRRAGLAWTAGARREPSLLGPGRVRLLNRERRIGSAADWSDDAQARLWLYHLHYCEDLVADDAPSRAAWHDEWIGRWICENPPGVGPGWEAYPLSRRIVNWIKWTLSGGRITPEAVHSLAVQARYLRASLEHHLLGNHLFANAKALVFAGLFFEGEEAERWLDKGLALVARELGEQVLADGGHNERSPLYHSLVLEDVLDLYNLAGRRREALPPRWRPEVERWRALLPALRRWLVLMCHPDGELSFFNDAATGVAPAPGALEAYARRLGLGPTAVPTDGVHHLAESGYVRLQTRDAVLLADVGELGPTYLPGHAHADTLSCELSLHGERWLVNSGTSLYGEGAERRRQRSTAAHNTVVVDGEDSSEVWDGFRVARRARPEGLHVEEAPGVFRVRCAHDGYLRLPGKVRHEREWCLKHGELVVTDRLAGTFQEASARYHLHPAVRYDAGRCELRREGLGGDALVRLAVSGAQVHLADSTWHPEFGRTVPSSCLDLGVLGKGATTRLAW